LGGGRGSNSFKNELYEASFIGDDHLAVSLSTNDMVIFQFKRDWTIEFK
jgi:hypothetical protein